MLVCRDAASTLSKVSECGHEQADRAPDGNIFDSNNAHLPLQRCKKTEEHHGKCGKARLANSEADSAREIRRNKDRTGQCNPVPQLVRSNGCHDNRANEEPEQSPCLLMPERADWRDIPHAQDRSYAENDPKCVMQPEEAGDQDGKSHRCSGTKGISQER
jgi:hypothetical protein